MSATIEREFEELDAQCRWQPLYLEIRNESHDYPHRVAKFPENRNRNRYRDVSPYDHSRVKLQNMENDYINASLVDIEEAQRSYVLTQSGESRTISHFHYTTWPDFGVPESPASFLNFLFKVRESGSLNPDHGPAVIHCSAGIGRSGTFSLVDTCLVLKRWRELSKEDISPAFDPSNKIMTEKYNGNRIGAEEEKLTGDRCTGLSSKIQDAVEENSESLLRKRIREDRKASTAQKVQQMKQRLNETERKRKRPRLTDT